MSDDNYLRNQLNKLAESILIALQEGDYLSVNRLREEMKQTNDCYLDLIEGRSAFLQAFKDAHLEMLNFGIKQYNRKQYSGAILIWQLILLDDPNNFKVKKYLDTAEKARKLFVSKQLTIAKDLLEKHDYQKASELLSNLLQQDTDNPEIIDALERAKTALDEKNESMNLISEIKKLIKSGNFNQADSLLSFFKETFPGQTEQYESIKVDISKTQERHRLAEKIIESATSLQHSKKYSEALDLWNQAMELKPEDPVIREELEKVKKLTMQSSYINSRIHQSKLVADEGKFQEAIELLEENLYELDDQSDALTLIEEYQQRLVEQNEAIDQIDTFLQQQDIKSALEIYKRWTSIFPNDSIILFYKVKIERSIASNSAIIQDMIQEAQRSYKKGDIHAARLIADEIKKLDPENQQVLSIEKQLSAEEQLSTSPEENEEMELIEQYLEIVDIAIQERQFDEAISILKKLISLDKANERDYRQRLLDCQEQSDNIVQADSVAKSALQAMSNRKFLKAGELWERVKKLDPVNKDLLENHDITRLKIEELKVAEKAIAEARNLALYGDFKRAIEQVEQNKERSENPDECENILIDLRGKYSQQIHLASSVENYLEEQKFDEAIKDVDKWLTNYPEDQTVKDIKERIKRSIGKYNSQLKKKTGSKSQKEDKRTGKLPMILITCVVLIVIIYAGVHMGVFNKNAVPKTVQNETNRSQVTPTKVQSSFTNTPIPTAKSSDMLSTAVPSPSYSPSFLQVTETPVPSVTPSPVPTQKELKIPTQVPTSTQKPKKNTPVPPVRIPTPTPTPDNSAFVQQVLDEVKVLVEQKQYREAISLMKERQSRIGGSELLESSIDEYTDLLKGFDQELDTIRNLRDQGNMDQALAGSVKLLKADPMNKEAEVLYQQIETQIQERDKSKVEIVKFVLPESEFVRNAVNIDCTIKNTADLEYVRLFYRIPDEKWVVLNQTELKSGMHKYTFTIPKKQVTRKGLELYLECRDINGSMISKGTIDQPIRILIKDKPRLVSPM